jgi:hypothetical protein
MKHPLFPVFASVVIATIAQAEDRKITGTFESVRFDLLMGLPESITEKHKEAWEKSKQMIVITEKDLVLNVGLAGASGGIYMSYTTQGDFLLGKTVIGKCRYAVPLRPEVHSKTGGAEVDQGLFTRICLETEEGPYRILYSPFWGSSGMDLAVVSIAGTTKELWETYAPIFDRMSAFELIDMKRFEK